MDMDDFIQTRIEKHTKPFHAFQKPTPWLCTPVCAVFGSETDSCSSTPMKMLLVTTTKVNTRSKAEWLTSLFLGGLTLRNQQVGYFRIRRASQKQIQKFGTWNWIWFHPRTIPAPRRSAICGKSFCIPIVPTTPRRV